MYLRWLVLCQHRHGEVLALVRTSVAFLSGNKDVGIPCDGWASEGIGRNEEVYCCVIYVILVVVVVVVSCTVVIIIIIKREEEEERQIIL